MTIARYFIGQTEIIRYGVIVNGRCLAERDTEEECWLWWERTGKQQVGVASAKPAELFGE